MPRTLREELQRCRQSRAGNGGRQRRGDARTGAGALPDASYVATDLNQPMLDYAATRQDADGRISWRQADAQALPFEDAAFDLVCCQFGVMFFPDRPAPTGGPARPQAGRVFPVQRWDSIEENVFADDVTNALAEFFPTIRRASWRAHRTAITIPR